MATARARAASRSPCSRIRGGGVREAGGQVERRQAEAWVAHDRQSSARAQLVATATSGPAAAGAQDSTWGSIAPRPLPSGHGRSCGLARRATPGAPAIRPLPGLRTTPISRPARSRAASPGRGLAFGRRGRHRRCDRDRDPRRLPDRHRRPPGRRRRHRLGASGSACPGRSRTAVVLARGGHRPRPGRPVGRRAVGGRRPRRRSTSSGRSTAAWSRSSSWPPPSPAWIAAR